MTRFRGGPADERYVWDPTAHEAYGERCHIYLLTGEDASHRDTFSRSLRAFLQHQNIYSYTIHAVYGPYDALLRVWLTQDTRLRLLRQLKQAQASAQLKIDDILEFAADEITYGFSAGSPTVEADTIHLEYDRQIREVVAAEHSNVWGAEAHATFATLRDLHLIVPVPPAPGVKFYLFLAEGPHRRSQLPDFVVERLMSEAQRQEVRNASLYFGVGFCDYILKGIVSSFEQLLPTVNALRSVGKGSGLAPWTLVVADYGIARDTADPSLIGETIDAVRITLPPSVSELLQFFDFDDALRGNILALTREDQDALAALFSEARKTLDTPEARRFAEILRSCLRRDRKEINQSLSFLTSIEGDLRFVLPRVMSAQVGKSWLRDLREEGRREFGDETQASEDERAWLQEGTSPKQWSLIQLMFATLIAVRRWPSVATHLNRALPPGWEHSIRPLVNLRNDYAHSKLVDLSRAQDFTGEWGATLRSVIGAIAFQRRMEKLREELEGGIDLTNVAEGDVV